LICFLVQLLILHLLEHYIPALYANSIGFILSAQLNFVLSYHLTWGDSVRRTGADLLLIWLKFELNAVLALCINSLLFGLAHNVCALPSLVAASFATLLSMIGTFLINHYKVFRPERDT